MKLDVEFGPIHGNTYTIVAALAALVYSPITISVDGFLGENYLMKV